MVCVCVCRFEFVSVCEGFRAATTDGGALLVYATSAEWDLNLRVMCNPGTAAGSNGDSGLPYKKSSNTLSSFFSCALLAVPS